MCIFGSGKIPAIGKNARLATKNFHKWRKIL